MPPDSMKVYSLKLTAPEYKVLKDMIFKEMGSNIGKSQSITLMMEHLFKRLMQLKPKEDT